MTGRLQVRRSEVARRVVESCPSVCQTSCIDCLQTFRNAFYHKQLERKIALEGVCIYLDGLSAHLHGHAATIERDRAIRTWLRNNGWDVIEIAANELHDEGAMQRHFRRLAGYLRADDLRARVQADTSWFGRVQQTARRAAFALRIVRPSPEERYRGNVPLVPLAAAGSFGDPQSAPEPEEGDWVAIDTQRRLRPGLFVAQVVGKSMEPQIPDGSWCLFGAPVEGTRQGKTVLVRLREQPDPEHGGRYTVKRYFSEKTSAEDGAWRHVKITLKPSNPSYLPIELTTDDEETVAVVAEMIEVLGEGTPTLG